MTITNVATLQDAVENWMERSFNDPLFLEFCASVTGKIERGVLAQDGRTWIIPPLRTRDMMVRTTLTSTGDSLTDWLAFERVWIDSTTLGRDLAYVPPQVFASDPRSRVAGTPQIYTIDANQFRAAPTTETELAVTYYQALSPLTEDASTNTVLTNHPRVYLHGVIAEACGLIQDYEREDRETMKLGGYVRALNAEKRQAQTEGGPLTMRPKNIA